MTQDKKILPKVFAYSLNESQSMIQRSTRIIYLFTFMLGLLVSAQATSCIFNTNFHAKKSHELHCVQKITSLPDVDIGRTFTSLSPISKVTVLEFPLTDFHAEFTGWILSFSTWTYSNNNIALYKLFGRFLI